MRSSMSGWSLWIKARLTPASSATAATETFLPFSTTLGWPFSNRTMASRIRLWVSDSDDVDIGQLLLETVDVHAEIGQHLLATFHSALNGLRTRVVQVIDLPQLNLL